MRSLAVPLIRSGSTLPLHLGAATAVFFLVHLILGDPAAAILLVVLSANIPGDALEERLAVRRSDR